MNGGVCISTSYEAGRFAGAKVPCKTTGTTKFDSSPPPPKLSPKGPR